jgi:formylglycine-generating enzyme required for sulfatase activity
MSSARFLVIPLVVGAVGCSGAGFVATEALDSPDSGSVGAGGSGGGGRTGGAGGGGIDAAPAGDAPIEGSVPRSDVVTSPCGSLRPGDETSYDRELCFEPSEFTMGSSAANLRGVFADHTPPHRVSLKGFVLDAYEVTVGRYRACVEAGGCLAPPAGSGCSFQSGVPAQPITCLTWDEAKKFCAWDGGRRLPTEAEWERAARGPTVNDYPWGQEFGCRQAVLGGTSYCPEHAGELPKSVGSVPEGVSFDGAHDIAGNVAEWVADWAGSYPSGAVTDPVGAPSGSQRLVRGGAWRSVPEHGMVFVRATASPETRGPWGVRCARGY